MASAPHLTPPTRAVSPSEYSQPSPERNPARRSLMDIVGNMLRENRARSDEETEVGSEASDSPPRHLQSHNRATARRSLLDLVGSLLMEDRHQPAPEPERRTWIDPLPPRLPSLDLPRPRPSMTYPRSPPPIPQISVQSDEPQTMAQRLSTASAASLARSSSNASHSSGRLQPPARVLDYGHRADTAPPEEQGREEEPHRHPADPVPVRHPADPLPDRPSSRSSAGTDSTSGSPQRHKKRRKRRGHGTGPRWIPRHSRGAILFPSMRYTAVRHKFFQCVITGFLTLLVAAVFLGLTNVNSGFAQEFRIITILFILIFAVLFLYALVRFLVLVRRVRKHGSLGDPAQDGEASFARITHPIAVTLVRDEELGLSGATSLGAKPEEQPAPAPPPPAYGRWRGSVRVDPNLIHWERVERPGRPLSEGTIRRPPSYISERDEVVYERQDEYEPPAGLAEKPRPAEAEAARRSAATEQGSVEVVAADGSASYTRIDPRRSWTPQLPSSAS